jgi:hypothetical protein
MNLVTVSLILGSAGSLLTILAYLYKGINRKIKYNQAKTLAQQGRTTSLASVV